MLLVLDNYDSFTWNLVQLAGELGAEPVVHRNDAVTVDAVISPEVRGVIVSPGPGTPDRAGISIPLIRAAARRNIPVLGVCLGHQAIAEAFGGRVGRANRLMHGKTTRIHHRGEGIFEGLADPLEVMRYHSLVVEPPLPESLEVTAWSADRERGEEVMGVSHRELPIHGVQFHPESIATEGGRQLLGNFLRMAGIVPVPAAGPAL
ncbi:MAG: anthranilate synthase component II [Gemmatimonadales bacterium]